MGASDTAALTGAAVALPLLALRVYCLADFNRTDERDMRTFTRPMWIVLLVFFNVFRGLMWLRLGRPQRPTNRS